MWDDFTWRDIPIPPREPYRVSIHFEDSRILPRFFLGDDRVRPAVVKEALLRPLVHSVRADGSLSLHSFLSFLREYEEGIIPASLVLEIDPALFDVTMITPAAPVLHFMFDGESALLPLAEADGVLFVYDGKGIFLSENSTWFSLPQAELIDPYLRADRKLSDNHFALFFKLVYPRLSQALPCYSSLTFTQKPPVLFTPIADGEGVKMEVAWQIDARELLTFPNNSTLCEYRGELYYHSSALTELADRFKTSGTYPLSPGEIGFFRNLNKAAPRLFTIPFPTPHRVSVQPVPIPPRDTTQKLRRLSSPPGATCTLSPVRPLNSVRSAHTQTFIKRFGEADGPPAPLVAYNTFTPSFVDLNADQRAAYLYARASYLAGTALKIDYTYLLLLIYEALNRADRYEFILFIWISNRERFRRLDSLLPTLLRDYIMLWDLPIPLSDILRRVPFDLNQVPHSSMFLDLSDEAALAALPFCLYPALSAYDYTASKAYSPAAADEFHLQLQKALIAADRHLRTAVGKGLWQSTPGTPTSFRCLLCSPAPLLPEHCYEASYRYESIIGDSAFRNLVGQIFKLAENLYRSTHGIRGKLRVELSPELAKAIQTALTPKKEAAASPPVSPLALDIHAAMALEQESWRTTDKLIAASGAFAQDEPAPAPPVLEAEPAPFPILPDTPPFALLFAALTPAEQSFLSLLASGADEASLFAATQQHLTMPDTLAESINEKALDAIGDILIEAGEILEEYREELTPYLST